MEKYSYAFNNIENYLKDSKDSGNKFSSYLRKNKIPHLSYTSISTIDFCPYRYYLTYITGVELDPPPLYFVKGRIFHEYAAAKYQVCLAKGYKSSSTGLLYLPGDLDKEHKVHIKNAASVLNNNIWNNWEIVGIEKPFVFSISDDIPPIVGVIDLLLKMNGKISIVDHKTGRDFFKTDLYDPSKLQMSIYFKYVSEKYETDEITLYYDKYRWINNLDCIRKPPFEREEVKIDKTKWRNTEKSIRNSFQKINDFKENDSYPKTGECFRCPYRECCW